MGEARRRKQLAELEDGAARMQAEGDGVWRISFYPLEDLFAIAADATGGDTEARNVMAAVAAIIKNVKTPGEKTLCLTCDTQFALDEPPAYIVCATANRDDPTMMMANAICRGCRSRLGDIASIKAAAADAYRELLIPDARVLDVHEQEGMA